MIFWAPAASECSREEVRHEHRALATTTGTHETGGDSSSPARAVLLQGYHGVSDAEAVELTVVDLRWQMVLDRLGCGEPAFSQGALFDFRERLIRTDMDLRLIERTMELARLGYQCSWSRA